MALSSIPPPPQSLRQDPATLKWILDVITASTQFGAFTDLTDTPVTLTADQFARANAGGTALEFATVPPGDWTDLDDTPGSITASQYVRGNAGGTALEFVPLPAIPDEWTDLTDTPGTITGDRPVKGNAGGTALEFNSEQYLGQAAAAGYLRRDGSNTITGVITPDGDETRDFGSAAYRLKNVYGRAGTFVGGSGGGIARVGSSSYSVFAGRSAGDGSNTLEFGSLTTTRPPVALFATSYAVGIYGTAEVSHGGGNAFMTGAAFSSGEYPAYASTSILKSSAGAFASFTGGYASSYTYCSGTTEIFQSGKGSFMWGYLKNLGAGNHRMTTGVNAAGSFIHGRTIGYSNAYIYSDNAARGSFTQGYITGVDTATGRISTRNTGSFAQGGVVASTAAYVAEIYSSGKGAFAQGYANGQGVITGRNDGAFAQGTAQGTGTPAIRATNRGSFAQGRALNSGVIQSISNGAFAQGVANGTDSLISAAANGAMARGLARGSYTIEATATGAHALGDTRTAALSGGNIIASATNAFQLGQGTNAVADSLQVGTDFQARANGQHAGAFDSFTLAAAATTFVCTANDMIITGDAGANTIATITGGIDGQFLCLLFVDALVTVTDDNTHAADSIDLSAAFTSADDTVLLLKRSGGSWYEVSRSVN